MDATVKSVTTKQESNHNNKTAQGFRTFLMIVLTFGLMKISTLIRTCKSQDTRSNQVCEQWAALQGLIAAEDCL